MDAVLTHEASSIAYSGMRAIAVGSSSANALRILAESLERVKERTAFLESLDAVCIHATRAVSYSSNGAYYTAANSVARTEEACRSAYDLYSYSR